MMDFGLSAYGLSFAAGGLSTLSPCVLPLLPILLGTAAAAHRLGPFALAAGLTLSFTAVGVFVASLGAALGIDPALFREVAAVILLGFGLLLLSARLQERFAVATSGMSGAGHALLSRVTLDGLGGQFVLGLLLGIVWSPCVGPTLGAAVTLVSQGEGLWRESDTRRPWRAPTVVVCSGTDSFYACAYLRRRDESRDDSPGGVRT